MQHNKRQMYVTLRLKLTRKIKQKRKDIPLRQWSSKQWLSTKIQTYKDTGIEKGSSDRKRAMMICMRVFVNCTSFKHVSCHGKKN